MDLEMTTGEDPVQLCRVQELASRLWSWSSRWHPGELAWLWWAGAGRGQRVATWRADGEVVAWARSPRPGRLDLQVDPRHPGLVPAVLEWFEDGEGGQPLTVTVLDADAGLREAVLARDYRPDPGGPSFVHLRRDLAVTPPPAPLPRGFSVRPVAGPSDAEARAAVHRAAFGGQEPSAATYRIVMGDALYRAELDLLALAPDGTPAAFCLGWWDERSGVVVLEPVGTDPRFRRLGLARACVGATLRAAAGVGARHARVCASGDDADPAPRATYEALGFRRYARNVSLSRPVTAGGA